MPESALSSVHVVLDEPRDPVNIAACVRAMKNMGVGSLRLVRPVEYDERRLLGVAHDTRDIIANARRFDSLEEALADCVRVAGFTARQRAAKRTVVDAHGAATELLAYAARGPTAVLFGREDRGLSNDALDRAHLVVTIPTTGHASLNLAQAVLVALYELHLAAGDATRAEKLPKKVAPPATTEQYERLFGDVERALVTIDFFKTRYPEHVMRTIRSVTHRAAPDAREIELLRAIAIEVSKFGSRATGGS